MYRQVIGKDLDMCVKCDECKDVCPVGCFDRMEFEECSACGQCVDVCLVDAIILG